jgi:hypothetical protein
MQLTSHCRVRVSGIKGSPPPPTTKLAVFYTGGYEAEILLNATGYGTTQKWDLVEKQIRHFLPESALEQLETLEFQRYAFLSSLLALSPEDLFYLYAGDI